MLLLLLNDFFFFFFAYSAHATSEFGLSLTNISTVTKIKPPASQLAEREGQHNEIVAKLEQNLRQVAVDGCPCVRVSGCPLETENRFSTGLEF